MTNINIITIKKVEGGHLVMLHGGIFGGGIPALYNTNKQALAFGCPCVAEVVAGQKGLHTAIVKALQNKGL